MHQFSVFSLTKSARNAIISMLKETKQNKRRINKMSIDRLENMDEVRGFEKALMMVAGKGLISALNFKNTELDRIDNELYAEMERMAREVEEQFKEWHF